MTTPSGGAYSKVVALLGGVQIDDLALADYLEIIEYSADGTVIARTYAGNIVDGSEPAFSMANLADEDEYTDPDNSDLMKLSWDIYTPDYKLVETLTGLLQALGLDRDRQGRQAIANMTALPVWNSAPSGLKAEVEKWLGSTETA